MDKNQKNDIEQSLHHLELDGFVMFRNFFSDELASAAHAQIEDLFRQDLAARSAQNIKSDHWKGPAGYSVLTKPTHLMLDVYARSPALDQMFEKFLTDPQTKPVIEKLAGKNIKLRGYNVRRMTGVYDPPPSHEWHRDSLGEFGFGILLTDVSPNDGGATSFLPGSHLLPYCPRWNNLFYVPRNVVPWLAKIAPINRRLEKKIFKNHTGADGKRGDAYIFINDTWHGRQPNLQGKEAMVVLIGAYPTDYEFPDQVVPPPAEILAKLPPQLAAAASCRLAPNEVSDTILRRIIKQRQPIGVLTLWRAAQLERRVVNILSLPYYYWNRFVVGPFNIGFYQLKKIYWRYLLKG